MKTIRILIALLVLGLASGLKAEDKVYKLGELASHVGELEKKEVVLEGTIIGTCKSGCKLWVAEGEYKDGDLFSLVRAKDDAFKFDVRSTGKKAVMKGYVVAQYLDYCAESGKEQEGKMDQCETPVDGKKAEKAAETTEAKKELKDLTFFATSIEYK
jgi:hypothetical protein